MPRRTGSADLPLHGGHVPSWLAARMSRLGAVISAAIIHHYGRDELLRRIAHPFWFQSFGAVMGMDWHSSGITTSVVGALKRGLAPLEHELGIHVCGGRGKHSRKTPHELVSRKAKTTPKKRTSTTKSTKPRAKSMSWLDDEVNRTRRLNSLGGWCGSDHSSFLAPLKGQHLEPKYSIHAIHGLDDRRILITSLNFAEAKDRQINTARVDTRSPARWCS